MQICSPLVACSCVCMWMFCDAACAGVTHGVAEWVAVGCLAGPSAIFDRAG
jgi:hypothetical protein